MKLFKKASAVFVMLIAAINLFGQDELLSAKDLLEKFSNKVKGSVKDYQASFTMTIGEAVQEGKVYFKNPQRLRIDFSNPANQVICTNGYDFWVYLPSHNFVLHQTLMAKSSGNQNKAADINPIFVNPVGFDKFLTDYVVEFNETRSPVDYKGVKVYQFKLLRWNTTKNGINAIYLYVQDNGLIRKIEGITASYRKITIEYDGISTNSGIPDLKFEYEPPAHARTMDNFILNQGDTRQ